MNNQDNVEEAGQKDPLEVKSSGTSSIDIGHDGDDEQDHVNNQQLLSQFLSMQDGIVPGDILNNNNTTLAQQYSNIPGQDMSNLNCNINKYEYHSSSSQPNDQQQVLDDHAIDTINQIINDIDQGKYQTTSLNSQLGDYLLTVAEYSNLTLVHKLLDRCPSLIHVTDSDGYTPLHRAAGNHDGGAVVEELIKRGANISAKTSDGWQPLHCACHWFHTDVASLLIQAGADINAKTNSDQTPLHLASRGRSEARSTIEMLLMNAVNKCDSKAVNSCRESAEMIAQRSGPNAKLFELAHDSIKTSFKQFRLSKQS